MSTPNTYGVTPETLGSYVADLTIDDRSSPNRAEVEEIILVDAGALRGICNHRGIATDHLKPGDATYATLKPILIDRVVAIIMRARNRGIDAEGFARQAGISLDRLIDSPTMIQEGAATSARYPKRDGGDADGPVRYGAGSIAGKIRRGGSL